MNFIEYAIDLRSSSGVSGVDWGGRVLWRLGGVDRVEGEYWGLVGVGGVGHVRDRGSPVCTVHLYVEY